MKTIKNKAIMMILVSLLLIGCERSHREHGFINSIGMNMIPIASGQFFMGDSSGQWDEQPVHRVIISRPFFISATEVTVKQFQKYRPDFNIPSAYPPYVTGISWYDAVGFCQWLSKKEGRHYRLPTEAEWEYVCRAGTTTPYASGEKPPDPETANPWGIKNMHTGALEWCWDWYGEYPDTEQIDPVGRAHGFARVVRGGLPDDKSLTFDYPASFYARSTNRASIAPAFAGFIQSAVADQEMPAINYDQFQLGLVGVIYDNVQSTKPLSQSRILYLNSLQLTWPTLNDWSAVWQGSITAPVSGTVYFHAEVDDGLTLTIAGQTVIHTTQAVSEISGAIRMTAGEKYPLTLRYFQDGGASVMRIRWSWEGKQNTDIPTDALTFTTWDALLQEKAFYSALAAGKKLPSIGFRVVAAEMPHSAPLPEEKPFAMQGIKQCYHPSQMDENSPYFRKRFLLPIPPENVDKQAILAAGFSDYFGRHNHDPGFTVCPNGDLLVVLYTSVYEDEPEVALIATRLRHGADQWDAPSPFLDFADVNDVAPNLWTDAGKIYLFFGNIHLDGYYPFQWTVSEDNGANWSEINYPKFISPVGPHTAQPINSVFRDASGTIYMACDGVGATSLLFASDDDGHTWYDTGGRTGGRHSTFALLRNGHILAMGGKHSDIDGFMPKSLSADKGKTWQISKSPFPCLGTNQRPTLIRLASGRLFMAGDYQRIDGFQPPGIHRRGSYVALSDDEGVTWHLKKLPGGQEHESPQRRHEMRGSTLGYAVAAQSADGLIHLIATMTHPCLHYTFNEAWILAPESKQNHNSPIMQSTARAIAKVDTFSERYANGHLYITYSGGIADDGRFLLQGDEIWYYPTGEKQYHVRYQLGKKVGEETFWHPDGRKVWQWLHQADGSSVWRQWWDNGVKKTESCWRNGRCDGIARRWDRNGKMLSEAKFVAGELQSKNRRP